MTKLLKVCANGIAYLYSGVVLVAFAATGFITLASVAIVCAGIFGFMG